MSVNTNFQSEFDILDPDSYLQEFLTGDDQEPLESYDASIGADHKGLLPHRSDPGLNPTISNAASSPESPGSSFPDSLSDSSSSKQSASSTSTKAGGAPGDATMTDCLEATPWKLEDLVNTDGDHAPFALGGEVDGTVNPMSIENGFGLEGPMDGQFAFNSPSSSPSPFTNGGTETSSPVALRAGPTKTKPSRSQKVSTPKNRQANRGHNKAVSQYSLTQSMTDLKTSGSRDPSPSSNMVFSQDSSPGFDHSPSPGAGTTFDMMNAANMNIGPDGALFPAAFGFVHNLPGANMPPNGASPVFPHHGHPLGLPGSAQFPMFQQPFFSPAMPPCRLSIDRTPLKSRVETQIPIKLRISPLPPGITRLHLPTHTISKPKLIARPRPERSPDMLELSVMLVCTSAMQNPEYQQRALARAVAVSNAPADGRADGEETEVKSQDGGEVRICPGCITRERKRAARKKAKKPEEEENWTRDEHRRVVVFNTHEVKDWQTSEGSGSGASASPRGPGQACWDASIDAPMRIACYCRHHGEKAGFQVIFTLKNHVDKVVAQAFSDSIMITDDHKTHALPPTNVAGAVPSGSDPTCLVPGSLNPVPPDPSTLSPGASFQGSHSTSDLPALKRNVSVTFPSSLSPANPSQPTTVSPTPRNLSRPVSPTSLSGPSSKKRKSSGGMAKVPSGLAMTRLETAGPHNGAAQPPSASQASSAVSVSTAASPFSPTLNSFSVAADSLFGHGSATAGGAAAPPHLFNAGPPTPNNNDQGFFSANNRSASMDNLAMAQLYSAPASAHPSRAPSPNNLRASANAMKQQQQQQQQQSHPFERAMPSNIFSTMSLNLAQPRAPASVIHKIIPNEGPKSGGIEVTILGIGFFQGLEVMFGDQKATTTTFWGESSLVCLLPPSPIAGTVLVTLKQNGQSVQAFTSSTKQQPVFKYIDDDEQQLMRTALSVLGHKMTGKIEDVRDVARRIIGSGAGGGGPAGAGDASSGWGAPSGVNGFTYGANFESQLLKVLDLIDLDDSTHKARLNLQRRTGQTMLHLACSLGLHRFVAGLLARGANADMRDKGGYTPLHIAALNNHHEIVRRLIYAGADPTMRTLSGLTAADLARSREVLKAIRRLERHTRSRSGGSLHSRANSAGSLRSLWEPATMRLTTKEYTSEESETSSGESPEYSEDATEEDDVDTSGEADDGGPWLDMRRPSLPNGAPASAPLGPDNSSRSALLQPPDPHGSGGLASPSAAVTAFREQFTAQIQHLQQAMASFTPNFPYFPQMPGMPLLPDYQAYLNSAPMLQRISSLVPNIGGSSNNSNNGGSRPGTSSAEQQQPNAPRSPPQSKDLDGKWWDFSALVAPSAPPPAYEDIFPDKDRGRDAAAALDVKQASAAQAAAEADADSKCARLYDGVATAKHANAAASSSNECGGSRLGTEEQEGGAPEAPKSLPALLQIGHKNAITKEQQDNLRRAHAENYKGLRSDKNLYMIWIPVLLVVLCATLYNKVPVVMSILSGLLRGIEVVAAAGRDFAERVAGAVADPPDRVVEVLP